MEVIKLSTDWAKAEIFSAKMTWLISLLFFLAALGFWQLGKTAMAKAFVLPMLVAGVLMVAVGAGLFFANKPRIAQFEISGKNNTTLLIKSEIERTAKSQKDFELVFKVLPLIIIFAAFLVMFFPMPFWRAVGITVIILMVSLMLIDSNTSARNAAYHQQLMALIK